MKPEQGCISFLCRVRGALPSLLPLSNPHVQQGITCVRRASEEQPLLPCHTAEGGKSRLAAPGPASLPSLLKVAPKGASGMGMHSQGALEGCGLMPHFPAAGELLCSAPVRPWGHFYPV